MKKIKYLGLLIGLLLINTRVYAASGSLSVSSSSVKVGESFTVTANISGAAWNVHVNSSGPVSGCFIAQANASDDALDTNKTFSATCTATGEGTISINLSGDVTSASDGNAVPISGSRSVAVVAKSNNENNNTQPSNNTNTTPETKPAETKPETKEDDKKSKNNAVKEITVKGQKLEKIDNNNYTLSVGNSVTSINITCVPEDNKSKVTGNGDHELKVGDNNIEIIVTSESGLQNKINIKVNRKEASSLDNLDELLDNEEDVNVNIKKDTVLDKDILEKVKDSKKTVSFNLNDENNKLIYSIIVDGSKLDNTNDLSTVINTNPDSKKEISKKSNYADCITININKSNRLPKGLKIKMYVGDKFNNNDKVNIYSYDKKELKVLKENVKVSGGYIEFTPDRNNDYFITMSKLFEETKVENNNYSSIWILIGLLTILVGLNFYVILRNYLRIRKQKINFK